MSTLHPHAEISLTPKGEAYALAHVRPAGCPDGVDPVKWRRAIERRCQKLADTLQGLISLLDGIDLDGDDEPTLGAPEVKWSGGFEPQSRSLSQRHWSDGSTEDGEGEDDADLEPSLCGVARYNHVTGQMDDDLEEDATELGEPTLGAPDHIVDQEHWGDGGCFNGDGEEDDPAEDGDPDTGIEDQPHDWLNEAGPGPWQCYIPGGGSRV
ncbi:MAG: hypothetical protein Devi2KO_04280 [Devosia indica]